MKKIMCIVVVLIVAACQQDKIGFVDNSKILEDYQEKKDVEAKFETKTATFNKKRDSILQSLNLEKQQLQIKLQNAKRPGKKLEEEIQLYQQKEQYLANNLQQEFQTLQQEGQGEIDSLVSKLRKEIKAYGDANGYTYILSGGDGGAVMYGTSAKDLTEEVLTILNEQYKQ
jgi:outer membrane protein